VLAWVRRELENPFALVRNTLFNEAPTGEPTQLGQLSSGLVMGTLDPEDANGDRMTYAVTAQPTRGTVNVNPDGTYVYTPTDPDLIAHGGTDTFTVGVDDRGFHLLNNNAAPTAVPVTVAVGEQPPPQSTGPDKQGFDVYNLTSQTLKLKGYTTGKVGLTKSTFVTFEKPAGVPDAGTIILPGQKMHFDIPKSFFAGTDVAADFTAPNGETYQAIMISTSFSMVPKVNCRSSAACSPNSAYDYLPYVGGEEIMFLDKAGAPPVNVGPNQADLQAQILNALCRNNSQIKCTFDPKGQPEKAIDKHIASQFQPIKNNTLDNIERTIAVADTFKVSTNWKISAEAEFEINKVINLGVKGEFGQTREEQKVVTDTIKVIVRPAQQLVVYAETPVYRDFGDFTIKMGNTDYVVRGVHVNTPDPLGGPSFLNWTTTPITN